MKENKIREKAESLLNDNKSLDSLADDADLPRIIEELRVHQIELELQNDELRRVHQDLEATQHKYLDLYNFAPVGYISFDPNGLIVELNYTAATLLRVPRAQLLGRTLVPYLVSDSISEFYQHCHAVLSQNERMPKVICGLTLKEAEGRPRYVQLESLVVTGRDNVLQIRSAVLDVTERKLAERQLRLSESKWATLVNSTDDLIWAIDPNFKLIRANLALRDKIRRETGYPLESGVDALVATPPEQSEMWRSHYRRAFRGEQFSIEIIIGNSFCEVSFNPIITDDNEVTGVVIFARDISERKAMEDVLRRRNIDLDMFAHSVVHDLQTPLGLITGYADYLTRSKLKMSETKIVAEKLKAAAAQVSKTIDELLLLAEVRHVDAGFDPVDSLTIVKRVVHQVGETLLETGGEISISGKLPPARGHERWVEKVWLNYLNYALKYGNRPPLLTIGGAVQSQERVRFWVRDNGPNLFASARAELDPRSQADNLDPPKLGLELSIVRRVIEKMGGEVGIEIRANSLSEMYFTLPAV